MGFKMKKRLYDNRELSWLKFNERVLDEARDETVPLCERLMFAAIFQSNLDEFFMIRAGSLLDRVLIGSDKPENKTGMTAKKQLGKIYKRTAELMPVRDDAYFSAMDELKRFHGIEQVDFRMVDGSEEEYLRTYFMAEILPLVSPQVIDARNPFPFLANKEIYAVAQFESKTGIQLGLIPASGAFSRAIFLPASLGTRFMLVEELILHYIPLVFRNYRLKSKSLVRITRNADINMEEALYDHDVDLRDVMADLLKKRKKLSPVRMELSRRLDSEAVEFLKEKLELSNEKIFRLQSPLELSFVSALRSRFEDKIPETFFPRVTPQRSPMVTPDMPVTPQVLKKDILLSYPYESMRPFLNLLNEAANDRNVASIKITLYRVAENSKIIEALINAAENGKEVLALVELRARFDEENNIEWSKRLEKAGCRIIYGPLSIKVHSKLLLITRKTGDKLEFITQIGTGNYNEKTSVLYTDLSLITANREIADDALKVFNALSTGVLVDSAKHLLVSPLCLQNRILELIDIEAAYARNGGEGFIGLKLNSLTDKDIMDKLAEASRAGVKIFLVIRGICCLIAGIPEYTENIEVISIVGRFLEHSRIYIFGSGPREKIYISSADFMTRNTLRRVEVAAPVLDPKIRERIRNIFEACLKDNVKARKMLSSGVYVKKAPDGCPPEDVQAAMTREAYENAVKAPISDKRGRFSILAFIKIIISKFRKSDRRERF